MCVEIAPEREIFTDHAPWCTSCRGGIQFSCRGRHAPGLIDLLSLPQGVKRVGVAHMSLNLAIVVLYVINAWDAARGRYRWRDWALSGVDRAAACLGLAAWPSNRVAQN